MKKGIAASKGYAIGQAIIKENREVSIVERRIENVQAEKERLDKAINNSRNQLVKIKEKAEKELGSDKAAVFESHIMLLDDPEFTGAVAMNIESNKVNAEKALSDVIEMYMGIFASMEDEYMRERAADVKDVGNRILANLAGNGADDLENLKENTKL
jgi:phosphotransferase system enzyme I (PtsI)